MKEKVKSFVKGKINYELKHDNPKDFVTSQWQKREKSVAYVIYRWFLAKFYLFSFIFSFLTSFSRGEIKIHFIYLTNWIMFASLIFTSLGAILTTLYYKDKLKIDKMTLPLKTYWFLSISCSMYALLISFTYWTILYWKENDNKIDINNVLIHMTNCIILIDMFVVKHTWKIAHFVWPLVLGCAFLGFSFIYPVLGGVDRRNQNYIYPILNWKKSILNSMLTSLLILILAATIHVLLVLVHHIRVKIHARLEKIYQNVPENTMKDMEALTC